jgi:hypothetical protein
MALVQRTHLIRLRFVDNDGAIATCELHLPQSANLISALSFASQIRALIAALSSAVCLSYDLIVRKRETAPVTPALLSDTQRAGVFIFATQNTPMERYIVSIPSVSTGLLLDTGPFAGVQLDLARPQISAFASALTDGFNGVGFVAPWEAAPGGDWGSIGGGGGSWGGGGGGGGSWGLDNWSGTPVGLLDLRLAYKGYEK